MRRFYYKCDSYYKMKSLLQITTVQTIRNIFYFFIFLLSVPDQYTSHYFHGQSQ